MRGYGSRAQVEELALDRMVISPTVVKEERMNADVVEYRLINSKLKEFMCDGFYVLCEVGGGIIC